MRKVTVPHATPAPGDGDVFPVRMYRIRGPDRENKKPVEHFAGY
jgi:hypothetical protein